MRLSLRTAGAVETADLGAALGAACTGRLAFMLAGEYGTGKTTLIQGLARGLGISGPVRSPSYNIVKVYNSGRIPLVHADLYRTQSAADIEELGIMDLLPDPGVLAVEWPGLLASSGSGLPEVRISLAYTEVTSEVEGPADSTMRLLVFELTPDCPESIREVLVAAAAG